MHDGCYFYSPRFHLALSYIYDMVFPLSLFLLSLSHFPSSFSLSLSLSLLYSLFLSLSPFLSLYKILPFSISLSHPLSSPGPPSLQLIMMCAAACGVDCKSWRRKKKEKNVTGVACFLHDFFFVFFLFFSHFSLFLFSFSFYAFVHGIFNFSCLLPSSTSPTPPPCTLLPFLDVKKSLPCCSSTAPTLLLHARWAEDWKGEKEGEAGKVMERNR